MWNPIKRESITNFFVAILMLAVTLAFSSRALGYYRHEPRRVVRHYVAHHYPRHFAAHHYVPHHYYVRHAVHRRIVRYHPPHSTSLHVVPLFLYPQTSGILVQKLYAIPLGHNQFAVRIKEDLSSLAAKNRLFYFHSKFIQLFPAQLDLNNRWLVLHSNQSIPISNSNIESRLISSKVAHYFGFTQPSALKGQIRLLEVRAREARAISSIHVVPSTLVWTSNQIARELNHTKSNLNLDNFNFLPRLKMFKCEPSSPIVKDPHLVGQISNATGLKCQTPGTIAVDRQTAFQMSVQLGDLAWNKKIAANRANLLKSLAAPQVSDLNKASQHVANSTPVHCRSARLTSQSDAYFCTRALRNFPGLMDSVTVLGRQIGQHYIYSVIRTSGYSANATHSIVATALNSMGGSQ